MSMPRTIQESYNKTNEHSEHISRILNNTDNMFRVTSGTINANNGDGTYTVYIKEENITVNDARLLYSKIYYVLTGPPNVKDTVKIYYKPAFTATYIVSVSKSNKEETATDKNSAIPTGPNTP